MNRVSDVIEAIGQAVPARKTSLDQVEVARLRELTGELIAAKPEAAAEYARFLGVKRRGLCLPEAELSERLGGATVLVTGGTGCIGWTLMAQLARPGRGGGAPHGLHQRARLPQCAGGGRGGGRAAGGVRIDRQGAAPLLARGLHRVQRAAEWTASVAAASGELLVSAARFTHVFDNSIIHQRLLDWAEPGVEADRDGSGIDPDPDRRRHRPASGGRKAGRTCQGAMIT